MIHRLNGCDAEVLIVCKHLPQEVEALLRHQRLVVLVDELLQVHSRIAFKNFSDWCRNINFVLFDICLKFVGPHDFSDFNKLIIVVRALEERVDLENHASHRTAKRPDVQRIVVELILDKELRSLVISGGHPHVVLLAGFVKVGQAPVDQPQIFFIMVNYNIEGFHISVHDSVGMTVVESFQQLEKIESDFEVGQAREQNFTFKVRNVFVNQTWGLGSRISHDVIQSDDVGTAK